MGNRDKPSELAAAPPELGDRPAEAAAAGGWGAIRSTLHHLRRETGVVRGAKVLLSMNQDRGFDCPGCAWPEPADRSVLEFCENGAKAVAEEATRKRATPELLDRPIAELRELSDFELGQLGRLTQPMVRRAGDDRYRRIDWDEAFALAGRRLRGLSDPNRAAFYTSGRTSNEAAFLYQLLVRELGTNNLPDCSNLCHESSGVGLSEVIGVGKGTVGLDDFERADLIVVVGQNPGTNHPRMLTTLREAARRGATIVSINPLRERGLVKFSHPQLPLDLLSGGVELARLHVPVRVGGDVALFQGLAKALLEMDRERPGVLDHAFIDRYTAGFSELAEALRRRSWDELSEGAGVSESAMRELAGLYAGADRTIVCWAMGVTQHEHAVDAVQEIVNLLLLRGNLGRPGAGACPVRGHSNVQGDRTVGITHRPSSEFLDRLDAELGIRSPRAHGFDVAETIEAMERGELDVFMAMGGNFYSAAPDTELVGAGLERCALTIHVSTKLNRTHLYPGMESLILPCLGRTELDIQDDGPQFVTVEDSMSMVHASRGSLEPASPELRSEPAIVVGLAQAVVPDSPVPWAELGRSYDRIRERMARVVPGMAELSHGVRAPGGFRLPNGARDRDFSAVPGGRARFTVHPLPDLTLPAGRLRLMTLRSHDQYNTTIYGLDDRYRGIRGERRVVFVHAEDMSAQGFTDGDSVDLVSEWRGEERRVSAFRVVSFDIPRGCAAAYFPEANPLVPLGARSPRSGTPASKSIVIRLERARPGLEPDPA